MIRNYKSSDFDKIKAIHEAHYEKEFSLNEFRQKFIDFIVIEEDSEIVCAGGVRTIAESVIITNKDLSPRERRNALYQMLDAQLFITGANSYSQLHAFIQDEVWKNQLMKVGFKPCKGAAVFIEVK